MSAKHTPGPWTYHDIDNTDWCISAGEDNQYSVVAPEGIRNPANAALIASAPDLLAERDALRAQVQELREALEKIVITASTRKADHRLRTLEIARAALAKVTPA